MNLFGLVPNFGHRYTLASTGLERNIDKIYCSRNEATSKMYSLCNKYGLRVVEVYDDKHEKTYICNNGVRFYIHRM